MWDKVKENIISFIVVTVLLSGFLYATVTSHYNRITLDSLEKSIVKSQDGTERSLRVIKEKLILLMLKDKSLNSKELSELLSCLERDDEGNINFNSIEKVSDDKIAILIATLDEIPLKELAKESLTEKNILLASNVSGGKYEYNSSGDVKIERIIDNKGQYAEGDIHNEAPSFRDVTVAQGENGNPIGIADNPSPIQNATGLLGKLMRGEEVKLQEASPSKFLINSGTEISILESDDSPEQPPTGFIDPIGFTKFEKIKILEGPHKGKTGWIHASMISHEERKK